jgi:hypothetical protein
MTDKASPDQSQPELARFLEDWTALWREELQAQANDPEGMAGTMELWRAAMSAWTGAMGLPPMPAARSRDHSAGTPRAQAAAAAPNARDAEVERDARGEIERLTRRVDELEARLGKLEATRRRRG